MARRWWEISAVSLLMLALAVVSTYPLVSYFDTGIPYAPYGGAKVWNRSGDQVQLLYWFWLVKENFIGMVPFDTNPYEFNMGIPNESSGLNTIPLAFLYMLFSPLGDIAAYNCTILSSYVLAGVFMYLLVHLYSGSRIGALLGAVIFTFAPSRINGFAAGHGYGLLYFCYPFIIYFLEKGIRSAKIRYGFIAALGLLGLSMLEPHLIYYLCVFLGLYIPFRLLAMFPVQGETVAFPPDSRGLLSWPASLSLLVLWSTGFAAMIYVQVLFACRDHDPFFTMHSWWVFTIYPFIPVLLSICLAAVYQRLFPVCIRRGLAIEAGSCLPLFILLPAGGAACVFKPADTGLLVAASLVLVVGAKVFLLRKYLSSIVKTVYEGIVAMRRRIWPIIPLVAAMGGVVLWIMFSKVEKVASTIAGGGRRLDDVGLYSSRLSDLFLPGSNVYIGIVTAALAGGFLFVLLRTLIREGTYERLSEEGGLIATYYLAAAFCCYILAMGLAFGKSSLYILFYHYFPFFNYPRVSDRIITVVLFALAIVAGFVVRGIQDRCKSRLSLGAVTLLVFIAAGAQLKDYKVFNPMGVNILDRGQDVYTHVKENIGDGLLLEIPLWPGDSHQSSLYQHYIMLDRVPRVNGCSPMVQKEYIDRVFDPLASINQGRFDRQQYDLLRRMKVKFITVHDNRDVFLEKVSPFVPLTTVRRLKNSPYLEFVDIRNMMYFKTWAGRSSRLYLFRVRNADEIGDDTQQAWYDMPYFYGVNSRLHRQTGEIFEDRDTGRQVFRAAEGVNKPGFLVYGPYDVYSPGDYRCFFTIRTDPRREGNVARLEIARVGDDDEVEVLAVTELQNGQSDLLYRKEFLDFSISTDTKLEFRVFYYGNGEVRVEKVAVYKNGRDKQLALLEAEKMVGDTGQLVVDEAASGGKAVEAISVRDKTGNLVYGPNRIYGKGTYTARFFLRTAGRKALEQNGAAALLKVTDGQDLTVYAQQEVNGAALNNKTYTGIDVGFSLDRDEDLSFQVWYADTLSIRLDRIEIIPQ